MGMASAIGTWTNIGDLRSGGGRGLGGLGGFGDGHVACGPTPTVPHRSISGVASGALRAWVVDIKHAKEEELNIAWPLPPPWASPAPSTASLSANELDRCPPSSNHD